jgi:hypothetical protein
MISGACEIPSFESLHLTKAAITLCHPQRIAAEEELVEVEEGEVGAF